MNRFQPKEAVNDINDLNGLTDADFYSVYDIMGYNFDVGQLSFNPTSIYDISAALEQCSGNCENLIMALFHYPEIGYFDMNGGKFKFFKQLYVNYRQFAQYLRYKELVDDNYKCYQGLYHTIDASGVINNNFIGYNFGRNFGYSKQYLPDYDRNGNTGYIRKVSSTIDNDASGKFPILTLLKESCTLSSGTEYINKYVINIDGTISFYDICGSYNPSSGSYINTPYGKLYNNPTENQILKRHDGFEIHFPKNEMYEAMEDASNSAQILQNMLDGSLSNDPANIDWTSYCVKSANLWTNYLIVDDEHDDGNVTHDIPSNVNGIALHQSMLDFCNIKRGAYFTNSELEDYLDTYTNLNLTYSINATNVYELFTYQQPTGTSNTAYIEGYNNHLTSLEDLDCACNSFKSDLYNYDQTLLTASVGASKIDELVEYYLEEGYLDLTNPADISAFKTTLLDWVSVCRKNVKRPKDFYDLAIAGNPTYSPDLLDIPFTELLINNSSTHKKDKVYAYYSCNEYASNDPQVLLIQQVNEAAKNASIAQYFAQQEAKHLPYIQNYKQSCLNIQETLDFKFMLKEYHYTLFYYDASGNLIKTIPPKGVNPLTMAEVNQVQAHRADPSVGSLDYPVHTLKTTYTYNSLNQIKTQTTPDAGKMEFWYDQLGRVILTQNAKQKVQGRYSYMVYDNLGRTRESGEVVSAPPSDANLNTVYGGNNSPFTSWLNNKVKREVSKTYYDEPVSVEWIQEKVGRQENLRGRISWVSHTDYSAPTSPSNPMYGVVPNHKFTTFKYYSYDVHGNVKRMIQRFYHYAFGNDFKTIEYDYDLVSGNVKKVNYQKNKNDQFFHKYLYDADNRMKEVLTSYDGVVWKQDANYDYYLHGPLKRLEIGASQIQGLDYAYTLQGWLKGVNGNRLQVKDMGEDGQSTSDNSGFGQDEFAFALEYFDGDYSAGNTTFNDVNVQTANSEHKRNLYNGNISQMYTGIDFDNGAEPNMLYNYNYDQLDRLTKAAGYENTFGGSTKYYNTYTYDKMGNFETLNRAIGTASIDELEYTYHSGTNRLKHLIDNPDNDMAESYVVNSSTSTTEDFEYDLIGNLVEDDNEDILRIDWNASGKVQEIVRTADCTGHCDDIEFVYDGRGNRVLKIVKKNGQNASNWMYTYYTYDAGGNQLATYNWSFVDGASVIQKDLNHYNIYGSDRLGIAEKEYNFTESQSFNGSSTSTGWIKGILNDGGVMDEPDVIDVVLSSGLVQRLANPNQKHLQIIGGEFLTMQFKDAPKTPIKLKTITPLKIAERSVSSLSTPFSNAVINKGFYEIAANTVVSLTPSGSSLDFNGGVSTGFNVLDFMNDFSSNYNNVIVLTPYPSPIEVNFVDYLVEDGDIVTHQNTLAIGYKKFELKNHVGNVLAVVSDAKENNQEATLVSATDYYPFGMQIPGRKQDPQNYRYGFQGQETDNEVKGNGNSIVYAERTYDPRIGRWMSVDQYATVMPGQSPYSFALNNPIYLVDQNGDYPKPSKLLGDLGMELPPLAAGILDGIVDASPFGTIGFMYDLATDSQMREDMVNAFIYMATDPVGFAKNVLESKVEMFQKAMEGDPDAIYELGEELGSTLSGIVTGAGANKLIKWSKEGMAKAKFARELKKVSSGGCACFVGHTSVLTSQGYKKIQDINTGDHLLYYDAETKKLIVDEVVAKNVQEVNLLYQIKLGEEIIEVSKDFTFMINGEYVQAKDVNQGDVLRFYDGKEVIIDEIKVIKGNFKVYQVDTEEKVIKKTGTKK